MPTPGPNVIKLFTVLIYECSKWATVFVPDEFSQPSVMFAIRLNLATVKTLKLLESAKGYIVKKKKKVS